MKKKLTLLMLIICMLSVYMFGTGTISASANISTNSPVGSGIMSGSGLNTTNFRLNQDTDPSSYKFEAGNSTYYFSDTKSATIVPMKKIPKDATTDGSKIVLQFDVYKFGTEWGEKFFFAPFATLAEWSDANTNYSIFRVHATGLNPQEGKILTSEVYNAGGETIEPTPNTIMAGFGFQMDVLTAQQVKGNDYATYWFEFNTSEKSYTVYAGNAGTNEKVKYATVKNAYTLPETEDGYYFVIGIDIADTDGPDHTFEFDNYKLYSEKDGNQTVYADFTFDDNKEIITALPKPETPKPDALLISNKAENATEIKSYDALVNVKNPGLDTSIITLNKLSVVSGFAPTFELSAKYKFDTLTEGRKVGIAMGLESYRTGLSAPKGGATFLYFTANSENKIVFGVENISDSGTATTVGEQVVLDGVALGSEIELSVVGTSDTAIKVKINNSETEYSFEGLKLSGFISFAQTGAADKAVSYSIYSNDFNLTAYSFDENEGTEVITSSFDGDYINTNKFAFQSIIAPESYYAVQPGTSHEVTGLTAENGQIGFYGTSTNTRLMFKQQYGDFVMQFDYISEPYNTRIWPSGLTGGSGPNRFSPLYILFGAPAEIPELATAYAMGIIDGNATQYFWGAESIVYGEGKLASAGLKPLSTLKETEQSDDAIPWFTSATAEPAKYGEPAGETYSLYNKTTRLKLVSINNNIALYGAPVDENGEAGEYVKLYETKVSNAYGYVGLGTDAPGWYKIDNLAITPISKEKALELGVDAVPSVDLVADVPVSEMAADPEPIMLAKPNLTINGNKVSWQTIENAKEYKITITRDNEVIETVTQTTTEYDLSKLTGAGSKYTIAVEAIPENTNDYMSSRATIQYTVPDNGGSGGEGGGGCGCNSVVGTAGIAGIAALITAGSVIAIKKKNKR